MAFSRNQQQLHNWGSILGVETPKVKAADPAASLKYWVKSNRRVAEIGKRLGDRKFLLVNFDRLCSAPKFEIQRIVSFLDVTPNPQDLESSFSIPKKPNSTGRYLAHHLDQFDPSDLEALQEFGFSYTASDG
jgi:hypothetical protein